MLQAQKGAPNGDFPTLRGGSVGVRPGCFMTTGSSSKLDPGARRHIACTAPSDPCTRPQLFSLGARRGGQISNPPARDYLVISVGDDI